MTIAARASEENAGAGSADPEALNRHGRAPRGARPRSQGDARRLASASACRVMARQGCLASTPRRLGALLPLVGGNANKDTRRPRADGQRAAKRCCVRTTGKEDDRENELKPFVAVQRV